VPTADPNIVAHRGTQLARVAIGLLAIAAMIVGGRGAAALIPQFANYVEGLGALGALLFVAGYAVATVAFVPGALLTLAAGAIFGLAKGVAIVFAGASIGSTLAFLVSRYLTRATVARRLETNARFAAVNRAIAADGRRIVFLLRLSPAFPFSLLNYALGITRISLGDYVMASVGMLPGTVLYVYYGKLAGDVAAVSTGVTASRGAGYYAVLVLGLVATVVVTTLVTKSARAALRTATNGVAV
jgi:uncharacterized membrane protein YdjX (TVP38/TMEM64 family)